MTTAVDEWKQLRQELAGQFGVSPEIHDEDHIFGFLCDQPWAQGSDWAVKYYFEDGAKSASKLAALVTDVCGLPEGQPFDLLEFASGFGCVTRHFKSALPAANVTACDIHLKAVTFLEQELNTKTIWSHADPARLKESAQFDVVFALSFFSHMPKRTFAPWLARLAAFVRPGGHLIFTTHGLRSNPDAAFDNDGFWFAPYSEQKDLDPQEYGNAVCRPSYVVERIFNDTPLSLKLFREAGWWEHQDLYVARA